MTALDYVLLFLIFVGMALVCMAVAWAAAWTITWFQNRKGS